MKTKKLYLLFGLPLIAFSVSVMAAEDGKTYPGALCQPKGNTQAILRDVTEGIGGMFNDSNNSQTWICPIVRDRGDSIEGAHIVVVDKNVAEGDPNVRCRLLSRSATGDAVASEVRETAGDPGIVTLEYGIGAPNINSLVDGYYFFRCIIPGKFGDLRSGVISYRLLENDGEN